jgi:DNA-directed RNA polymerase subunit RPC12/RpoP
MPGNKPITPVKPAGMEIIFLYQCPHCGREVTLIAPTRPAMAQCDACRKSFPIVPVDDRALRYFKIILAGGKAAIDPDFL